MQHSIWTASQYKHTYMVLASRSLARVCLTQRSKVARHTAAHVADALEQLLLHSEALAQEGAHILPFLVQVAQQVQDAYQVAIGRVAEEGGDWDAVVGLHHEGGAAVVDQHGALQPPAQRCQVLGVAARLQPAAVLPREDTDEDRACGVDLLDDLRRIAFGRRGIQHEFGHPARLEQEVVQPWPLEDSHRSVKVRQLKLKIGGGVLPLLSTRVRLAHLVGAALNRHVSHLRMQQALVHVQAHRQTAVRGGRRQKRSRSSRPS
mmetsp:Transcript_13954/g.28283  ORF Transcript_13954/g.28283 Transcript_13954/m.28283 type:complete len:262 (+) Transcript_13954:191-976(+)